jgi:hypothetical protein
VRLFDTVDGSEDLDISSVLVSKGLAQVKEHETAGHPASHQVTGRDVELLFPG